jgi:hypothetical protein
MLFPNDLIQNTTCKGLIICSKVFIWVKFATQKMQFDTIFLIENCILFLSIKQ